MAVVTEKHTADGEQPKRKGIAKATRKTSHAAVATLKNATDGEQRKKNGIATATKPRWKTSHAAVATEPRLNKGRAASVKKIKSQSHHQLLLCLMRTHLWAIWWGILAAAMLGKC